ncbi:diguanylate cyclase [Bifidobacterium sp. SMB2]|uniref:Diguanylate cyclase n=1 Tax=Bifidobacterium saimiriisciurei TaxID=2661627 RepID=A0ABX0CB87_9BIFI|nr:MULTISPECIES: diguanylate cyclase [Bifidobacterium]NEG96254.1 diguanylate cyclase [Bifidobacterium sp. SMB2]NEH12373.1 diguanylate cyclase [Bifidobacterium saimiriisciurei]
MSEKTTPFYDVDRTYEDNYAFGPFGAFAEALGGDAKDGVSDDQVARAVKEAVANATDANDAAEPAESFFGIPVDLPFGIPAGPLLNERYTTAAFRMGFDLAVYKTVRSRAWGCNPFPNVLAVHPKSADGILSPGSDECDEGVLADHEFETPISISNSFGVPSQDPDVWQPDMQRAMQRAGRGQLLVPSFQGSRHDGMTAAEYVADHVTTAHLVMETGAKVMEMNTSCPNEGHNRLLCHAPDQVSTITEAVKNEIGDTPLIIKLAYLPSDEDLEYMVRVTAGRGLVQGFSTINTISAKLVDARGNQALPGAGRDRSGVCGAAIKPSGLDMVRRLAALRERLGLDFGIVGVGGVTAPADYAEYRSAGADAVMSATGAMWNPDLARRIKRA